MDLTLPISQKAASKRRGFTLIEIIVVVAIIATLLAIGVGSIKNLGGAKGVNTGVSVAEGVFEHARALAKANGAARVLIYCDTGGTNKVQRERYLRYLLVASGELKPNGDPANSNDYDWKVEGGGVTLPVDTFYNANLSPGVQKENMKLPGLKGKKECYYYEFNSEGALVNPSSDGSFVIQAGKLLPGKDVPKTMPKKKRDVGGFRIWKSGKTSLYRSPNQISTGELDF